MFRLKIVESHLFQSSAFSRPGNSHMPVARRVATFQKPSAKSDAEASDLILRFRNENKTGAPDFLQCLFVNSVQSRLVEDAYLQTLFLESLRRSDCPVKGIAKRHDKTIASIADYFIFAR